MAEHTEESPRPLFSVLRGDPTEEELAALTVALLQRGGAPEQKTGDGADKGRMSSRRQRMAGWRPGPGSWRRARPR